MTSLESPRRNNDCYFYYYSTCRKGDRCTFRHEPSALGCETMCAFWKEGKCLNVQCSLRHMELQKNRKAIACYWESQPVGCLKPHCPFMHKSVRPPPPPGPSNTLHNDSGTGSADTSAIAMNPMENYGRIHHPTPSTVVDSLVVNFEEESDNDSAGGGYPYQMAVAAAAVAAAKCRGGVKTLEEIRLDRVQAEAAAYYSLPPPGMVDFKALQDLRDRLSNKRPATTLSADRGRTTTSSSNKRPRTDRSNNINVQTIHIKTLDEIRAERDKHTVHEADSQSGGNKEDDSAENDLLMEMQISSSSNSIGLDEIPVMTERPNNNNNNNNSNSVSKEPLPKKKIKLRRLLPLDKPQSTIDSVEYVINDKEQLEDESLLLNDDNLDDTSSTMQPNDEDALLDDEDL